MDSKEKNEKKKIIGKKIDLGNGRFKDEEIDILHDLATNPEKYNGKTKLIKNEFTGWSSEGKYKRKEETTFILKGDNKGVRIEEKYQYHDDDGMSGKRDVEYKLGREILSLFNKFFKD